MRRVAFTLIELLVVLTIVSVLAAIIFPIAARAKNAANVTQDISQMRQTYLAIKLYQEDTGAMPPLLTTLVPNYIPKEILHGAGDHRRVRDDGTYPGNPVCYYSPLDPSSCPRSPFMVSYAYLNTFSTNLPAGISFADLEARPEVGLLADLHHAELSSTTDSCDGQGLDESYGPCHDSGIFIRTRMDGSTKVMRISNWGITQVCSWEECFLR